ncbi:MAG: hypothetical protein HXX14_01090 [Bacteroidetes bacterium]|nr:hypothetical protein [Bacteroidota bacterium]
MKKILLSGICLIALLLNSNCIQAQYDYLKFENTQLYFEKVYSLDSLKSLEVEKNLLLGIPKLKDVTNFQKSPDIITLKIENSLINYRKYGGKWATTAAFLNNPFFADVSIVWKEGKYKVTISNMYFNTAGFGIMKSSNIFLKKHGSEFDSRENVILAGQYVEKYLADLFLIKKESKDW